MALLRKNEAFQLWKRSAAYVVIGIPRTVARLSPSITVDTPLAPFSLNAMAIEIFQKSGCNTAGNIRAIISIVKFVEKAEIIFESTKILITRHRRNLRFILLVNDVIKGDETATVMATALSSHPAVSMDTRTAG